MMPYLIPIIRMIFSFTQFLFYFSKATFFFLVVCKVQTIISEKVYQHIPFIFNKYKNENNVKIRQTFYIIPFMKRRQQYLTEKIKNAAYNMRYMFLGYFQEYSKEDLIKPGNLLHILGMCFQPNEENVSEINKKIYEMFEKIIWITYRSGFPQLPTQMASSYVSDTGWGCMVRVGQMLFAQIIKRHLKVKYQEDLRNILNLFNDVDPKQPFSIQNIVRLARKEYNLIPGEWYNPSQISFILAHLHEKHLQEQLKLKFNVFNNGNLFFDSITDMMLGQFAKCQCDKKTQQFICVKCNKKKYSVAIIVLIRIGLNYPQQRYLQVLEKFMEIPCFQGVIGGKPKKALYFVGKHKNYYIYLDPHFVHGVEENIKEKSQSYFCGSFRKCKNTSIDSSLGISFYLEDVADLNKLHRDLNKIRQQSEDFFIFMADETPNYIKQSSKTQANIEVAEESFEVL